MLTSILISDVTCVCTKCCRQCSQTNSKYTIGDTVYNEVDWTLILMVHM